MGGTISVKSIPGEGSIFTLILPEKYSADKPLVDLDNIPDLKYEIRPNQATSFVSKVFKTILLVEDSEPAIIQMKDILEDSGYHLLIANNGEEALKIITYTIPDAMILDLMMPGIDGFEVLKTLREAEPTAHIPVLILTAKHITKEELRFLKRNNVHQLIQKGDVNRDDLLGAVSKMVSPVEPELLKPVRTPLVIQGKPIVLVVEDNRDNMITV